MTRFGKRIVFFSAGAVGGHDMTLAEPWPAHVDAINRDPLRLSGSEGDRRFRIDVTALHITEVQQLASQPDDLAFICTKLYDTEWAAQLDMEPIRGVAAEKWLAAAGGDDSALREVGAKMFAFNARRTAQGCSGTAKDLAKGRRTEVDDMNGYVAAQGPQLGVPAPTHAVVSALVRRMERGELVPSRGHVVAI